MGFVEGAGTTDQPQIFRFRTDDLRVGTHRFRLRQVATDGSVEFTVPPQNDAALALVNNHLGPVLASHARRLVVGKRLPVPSRR